MGRKFVSYRSKFTQKQQKSASKFVNQALKLLPGLRGSLCDLPIMTDKIVSCRLEAILDDVTGRLLKNEV